MIVKSSRVRRVRGFTLVELLVVIAIIGVLAGMLLPAVQAAREAARRTTCTNNMKQLSLALQNYHDTFRRLPPGGLYFQPLADPPTPANDGLWGPSWIVLTLPFFEQQNLHDSYNFNTFLSRSNPAVVATELEGLICPSDSSVRLPWVNEGVNFARGNYAVNGGRGNAFSHASFAMRIERGPFHVGMQYGAKFGDIEDGLSNTVLLAEMLAGGNSFDVRGAWAYPPGVYISGGESPNFVGLPPNSDARTDPGADRPAHCNEDADVTDRRLRCFDGGARPWQTARSRHPGNFQIALADGSVRSVSDSIPLVTWLNLLGQSDGQVVGEY